MAADGQTALVRAPISAGGSVAPILANSFDDAWRIAGVMAASGLTSFKRQEEACAAIMAGGEVGLPPFASLQSFMFVNGRLSMWGDAMLALVQSRGHKVEEWYDGSLEEGSLTAWTKVTRADNGIITLESFSIDDAKRAELWQTNPTVRRKSKDGGWYDAKNDSPWYRYQKRMLRYRARGFSLRDGCSDVLRGIRMVEEVRDYPAVEDVPMQARVVGSEDFDQRPADERVGGVIGGKPARDAFDDLALRMSESEDAAALEEVWSEAENANLSSNRMFGLSEHYEACKEAHENGKPTPAAPTFSKPPPPSPFEGLKEAGAVVDSVEAFNAWNAQLKTDLARCTDEERTKLKALHTNIKAKFAPPKESAGAGGSTDKDAGHKAAESSGADPGGEAPPASESAFERLKQACLDCLEAKAKRRALADWRKEVDACADLTDAERADLDKIEGNVREGLSK